MLILWANVSTLYFAKEDFFWGEESHVGLGSPFLSSLMAATIIQLFNKNTFWFQCSECPVTCCFQFLLWKMYTIQKKGELLVSGRIISSWKTSGHSHGPLDGKDISSPIGAPWWPPRLLDNLSCFCILWLSEAMLVTEDPLILSLSAAKTY